jgi:hypothetical protein
MHIERSERIQDWIHSGLARIVPPHSVAGFYEFLKTLPWSSGGGQLDWTLIEGTKADLSALTPAQLLSWFRTTPLGRDPYLVLWFAPNEACIACEADFAVINLDQAFWKAPGTRYIFGASFHQGTLRPVYEHFAEYDGADSLMASLVRPALEGA